MKYNRLDFVYYLVVGSVLFSVILLSVGFVLELDKRKSNDDESAVQISFSVSAVKISL